MLEVDFDPVPHVLLPSLDVDDLVTLLRLIVVGALLDNDSIAAVFEPGVDCRRRHICGILLGQPRFLERYQLPLGVEVQALADDVLDVTLEVLELLVDVYVQACHLMLILQLQYPLLYLVHIQWTFLLWLRVAKRAMVGADCLVQYLLIRHRDVVDRARRNLAQLRVRHHALSQPRQCISSMRLAVSSELLTCSKRELFFIVVESRPLGSPSFLTDAILVLRIARHLMLLIGNHRRAILRLLLEDAPLPVNHHVGHYLTLAAKEVALPPLRLLSLIRMACLLDGFPILLGDLAALEYVEEATDIEVTRYLLHGFGGFDLVLLRARFAEETKDERHLRMAPKLALLILFFACHILPHSLNILQIRRLNMRIIYQIKVCDSI